MRQRRYLVAVGRRAGQGRKSVLLEASYDKLEDYLRTLVES
jgi:hypothetical protein